MEEAVQQLCVLVAAGKWDCSAAQDTLQSSLQAAAGEAARCTPRNALSKLITVIWHDR